jgi:hypothetical protein
VKKELETVLSLLNANAKNEKIVVELGREIGEERTKNPGHEQ